MKHTVLRNDRHAAARFVLTARFRAVRDLEQVSAVCAVVSAAATLIHELQKERGVWNVHLGSGGRLFSKQIAPQTAICQKREQELRARFDDLDRMAHGAALFSGIRTALADLDALPALRERAGRLAVEPANSFACFCRLIGALLGIVSADPTVSRALTAARDLDGLTRPARRPDRLHPQGARGVIGGVAARPGGLARLLPFKQS